ncbi:hypothetical protein [Rhodopila sp.]|uniref:hypothetical protein n=1 Tax=Rhodopila sp. TaxID=2480087 RepID=UPI003D14A48A
MPTPTVSTVTAASSTPPVLENQIVTLTVNLNEAVTVDTTGGTPTLSLNDGETASYVSGSGSSALVYSYTVAQGDYTPNLQVTGDALNGGTIQDASLAAADLSGATNALASGLSVDGVAPTVTGLTTTSNKTGPDVLAGQTVTLTVTLSEAATVDTGGGVPSLTLNDGRSASYMSGSGGTALVFSYTVAEGDTASNLQVINNALNGGTILDAIGNPADLSGANGGIPSGLVVNGVVPTVTGVAASGSGITAGSGDLNAGNTVLLTVNLSEAATVDTTGGTPTLTLNDGGTASYVSGSGSNALVFSYTVANGQNTASLAVTGSNLNSATILDGAGNAADLSGANVNPPGTLQIDTITPTVTAVAASGPGITAGTGDLDAGHTILLTASFSTAVTVNTSGGTPTLTLNDGGTASYVSGSGTGALVFSHTVAGGQNVADLAVTGSALNSATILDGAGNAADLTGAIVNPPGTLQIDTTAPTITAVAASGPGIVAGSADLGAGSIVTLTASFSTAVTVAGGTPTLTLNDGGIASYVSGSGSNALVFSYTVGSGQNTADLAVTGSNLNSATILDGAGNAADLSGANVNPPGTLQIDTTAPTVTSVAASGPGIVAGTGDLDAGSIVTVTASFSTAVTVAGGTPTLTLNDGGIASYVSGSGSSALVFRYTVAGGQNVADLAVTGSALNSATILDGAGNAADLSGAAVNPPGTLQIDTTAPTVTAVATSGLGITAGTGDLDAGHTVLLTASFSTAVTVAGGTPTLTLNDGGTASYLSGSGSSALVFSYTVAGGQNVADLAVTGSALNSATILDGAGNAADLSGAAVNPPGTLQIDTTAPTVTALTALGSGITAGTGDLDVGNTVLLTANFSTAVTVADGIPTLILNDGGTATYQSGSGSNALVFSYTVANGQNTADLAVTSSNLNGATILDAAGNAAFLAGAVANPPGTLQIDTIAPTVTTLTASGSGIIAGSGDLDAGSTVLLTASFSTAVTVAGGIPTLSLNDGGTASYLSGSGSNALVFSYTVANGQNTTDLAVTASNLNSATILDGAGNAANLAGAAVNPPGTLRIDTIAPIVTGVAASGSGITAGTGDLGTGHTVTLTATFSKTVIVDTTGGTPTLTLNDGGTASYVSGSGSSALVFDYAVGSGENTADLAVTSSALNSATILDAAGNAADLSGAAVNPPGTLQIDTIAPIVTGVAASGSGITAGTGDLNAGNTVLLTTTLSKAVTVDTTGGTPTLTLNDGGTATYQSGSGTSALVFSYIVVSGQNTPDLAVTGSGLHGGTISDVAGNAADLTGVAFNPPGTLQINTMTPAVTAVAATGSGITAGSGDLDAGHTVTLTATFSEAVTVAGGTPTLTLNDGGTASYLSGSGSNALVFSYAVGIGQNTTALAVIGSNLNSATILDTAGNAANLAGANVNPPGTLQIDTTAPTVTSVAASGSGITAGSGDLDAGNTVTLTATFSKTVTVNTTGGTPLLTLNDGGTASYVSGSGSNALVFSYTVANGQNTASLAVTGSNLNSATILDGAGNAADLSGANVNPPGTLQIDTITPTVTGVAASGPGITAGSGDLDAGSTVLLTASFSTAVTVNTAGGTPTLTLNDGGTASYVSGSSSNALVFSHTVAGGQNVADLAVTGSALNGATILDGAGNAADLSGANVNPPGTLQIDTTAPTVTGVAASGSGIVAGSADLGAGGIVTLTASFSTAVTVDTTGGTPTLTLNDGGTASYLSGSGSNALVFRYTVGGGQNVADLAVTSGNLNSATILDGAGNAADLSGAAVSPLGTLQIDTTAPMVTAVAASSASTDLGAGQVVLLTASFSTPVTVDTTDGMPTLTLNDGGTAHYQSGSGTSDLVFRYTVAPGDNTTQLAVMASALNQATILDNAGNAADLTNAVGVPTSAPRIDTITPTVSSVTGSSTSADLGAGQVVLLTATFSDPVTVDTTGGTPTLTLNDGGTARYQSGSGTDALVFSYIVGPSDNTPQLGVTGNDLAGGTITSGAGNPAYLAGLVGVPAGAPRIDTTPPTVTAVTASPAAGVLGVGAVVALTVDFSKAVNVDATGGMPTLTLNDGGTATYASGSSTNALVFDYITAAGQTVPALAVTAANLNGATVSDAAGNMANLTGAATALAGTLAIEPSSISAFSTSSNQAIPVVAQAYTGPVAGLQDQYVNITSSNLNITVTTPNWFLHSGNGDDALAVTSGNNVLDGGGGSNFLTGGTGSDTFFVDGRGATADIWSTVVNFHAGDALTMFGVTPTSFTFDFEDGQGAGGYTGLTLHATAPGSPTFSATFAGLTKADLTNGRLSESSGTEADGSTYTYFHGNA